VLSVTVTVKLPLADFPAPSVAEQSTVVVPTGNADPDAGEQFAGSAPETASLALAEYVTTFPELESASIVMFEGRLRLGGVVSWTVTVKEGAVAGLPAASLAVHETVEDPSGNVVPEGWSHVITGAAPLSSVAVIV
jgi:hypothetical protein